MHVSPDVQTDVTIGWTTVPITVTTNAVLLTIIALIMIVAAIVPIIVTSAATTDVLIVKVDVTIDATGNPNLRGAGSVVS